MLQAVPPPISVTDDCLPFRMRTVCLQRGTDTSASCSTASVAERPPAADDLRLLQPSLLPRPPRSRPWPGSRRRWPRGVLMFRNTTQQDQAHRRKKRSYNDASTLWAGATMAIHWVKDVQQDCPLGYQEGPSGDATVIADGFGARPVVRSALLLQHGHRVSPTSAAGGVFETERLK